MLVNLVVGAELGGAICIILLLAAYLLQLHRMMEQREQDMFGEYSAVTEAEQIIMEAMKEV